jgi:hypothetical protein
LTPLHYIIVITTDIRKGNDMRIRKTTVLIMLIAAILWLSPVSVSEAANIQLPEKIHETIDESQISPGVVHENHQRFTTSGWWNINVLRVDLTDKYTSVGSLFNPAGLSSRDSIGGMVEKKNAIAGINGDFYNFQPIPNSLGALVDEGRIISSPNHLPVFYLMDNEAFVDYFTTKITLTNWRSGYQLPVTTINKVSTNFDTIMMFNSHWGPKSIGNRFHQDLTEFLVINDVVADKRTGGAPFDIPLDENSFVISSRSSWVNDFQPGDRVQLDISITPDLRSLQFAIGAGGIILKDGQVTNTDVVVSGNHPRTGIGISKDGKEIILVTIDGRDSSFKGVSQEMFGAILKDLGAWNGVNLDGGGSTTMVVKPNGEGKSVVVNKPSEGTQRLVVNGVGVFSSAPMGMVDRIEIVSQKPSVFVGESAALTVKVYDQYHNLLVTDPSDVRWRVSGAAGRVSNGSFYAETSGVAKLTATYQGVSGEVDVKVLSNVVEIETDVDSFNVAVGGSRNIGKLVGLDKSGYSGELSYSNVSVSVTGGVGEFKEGIFYASRNIGAGSLILKAGDAVKTIRVSVGSQTIPVTSFEDGISFRFSGYPATVIGSALPSMEAVDGRTSIELSYDLSIGEGTRAAYVEFMNSPNGISLPGSPVRIGLMVNGDSSGTWLRGTLIDSAGKSHVIDFSKAIDFTGWRQLEASVPDGVAYPVSLQRVYVAEVNEQKFPLGRILIDALTVQTPTPFNDAEATINTKVQDPLEKSVQGGYRLVVYSEPAISGNTLFSRIVSSSRLTGLIQRLNGANTGVQLGNMSQGFKSSISHSRVLSGGSVYGVHREGELAVITLQANSEGIRAQDSSQWMRLIKDINAEDKNLVLVVNRTISSFSDSMEASLLHNLLVEAAESGKNVYVVQSGSKNTSQLRDGVRYIELTGTKASTPYELSGYSYFELAIDGKNSGFQLVKPFGL